MHILSEMYLRTVKSALNSRSHPATDLWSGSGLYICIQTRFVLLQLHGMIYLCVPVCVRCGPTCMWYSLPVCTCLCQVWSYLYVVVYLCVPVCVRCGPTCMWYSLPVCACVFQVWSYLYVV